MVIGLEKKKKPKLGKNEEVGNCKIGIISLTRLDREVIKQTKLKRTKKERKKKKQSTLPLRRRTLTISPPLSSSSPFPNLTVKSKCRRDPAGTRGGLRRAFSWPPITSPNPLHRRLLDRDPRSNLVVRTRLFLLDHPSRAATLIR